VVANYQDPSPRPSLNHFIGTQQDRLQKYNAERFSRPLVDGKFELIILLSSNSADQIAAMGQKRRFRRHEAMSVYPQ